MKKLGIISFNLMQSSLHPDTAAAVSEVLQRSEKPLSVRGIRQQLAGAFRLRPKQEAELKTLLQETASIHEWPKSRFWIRDPKVIAETALLEAASDAPLTRSALNKAFGARVKAYPVTARNALIEELIGAGRLFQDPPWGGARVMLTAVRPDREHYRQALEDQIKPILARFAAAGLDPRPLIDQICTSAADPPAATGLGDRILDVLNAMEPRKGLVVSAHRLRRVPELAGVDKAEFDEAVMRLAAQHRVFLHDHGAPLAVQPGEREELVTDGKGGFYVGIAWRDPGESAVGNP